MNISDSQRGRIRETAREIIEARTDFEFNEACHAMLTIITVADIDRPREPVSAEAHAWAAEAAAEVEGYKAANPDWERRGKSLADFRRQAKE